MQLLVLDAELRHREESMGSWVVVVVDDLVDVETTVVHSRPNEAVPVGRVLGNRVQSG